MTIGCLIIKDMTTRSLLLLALPLRLLAEPARIENTGWHLWSQRDATAPKVYIDDTVTRSGQGALVVSGNANALEHGGWERSVPVKPGQWYRFTAYYRLQGIANPSWQVVPRLDWQAAAGKRTGQPDYSYKTRTEGDWTKTWIDVQAPEKATAAAIQLFLSQSPSGIVWWDDVSLEEIAAPAERKIKIATINLRPRGSKSREENCRAIPQSRG